jgi:DNA-binding Lrp family transcriptional regulator
MKHKLDAIDRKILEIMQSNAKITNAQLSKEIDLSPAPTLERVKKLEQFGIIKSYHATLDRLAVGLGVITLVKVTLIKHKTNFINSFIERINQIPEVIECHHITGDGDFILKVVSEDMASYQKLMLDVISEIPEVDNLQSTIILSTYKDSKVLPLPHTN